MKLLARFTAILAAMVGLALAAPVLAQSPTYGTNYGGANYNGVFPGGQGAVLSAIRIIALGSSYTLGPFDNVIEINKTAGSPTSVILPNAAYGTNCIVFDGKGDAATNNITITSASGALINGASSLTINTAYGSKRLFWDGSQWLAR